MYAIGTNVLYAYSARETWSAMVAEHRPTTQFGTSIVIEFDGVVVPAYAANGSQPGPQGHYRMICPLSIDGDRLTLRPDMEDDFQKRAAWSDIRLDYMAAAAAAQALKDDATFASFSVGATVSWIVDMSYMWMVNVQTHTAVIQDLDRATMTANVGLPERKWLGHLTLVV
jgi:hypothetical protein